VVQAMANEGRRADAGLRATAQRRLRSQLPGPKRSDALERERVSRVHVAPMAVIRASQGAGPVCAQGSALDAGLFFKRIEVKDRNEGADADATRSLFLMRASPVFNVAQCEGVRIPNRAARVIPDSKGALGVVGPIVESLHLDAGLQFGGDQAYYAPGPDLVQMPHAEAFSSRDAFHAVLLHECGHTTGHTSRLKREFGDRFGSDGYPFEELVAELTSAFTQAVLGIRADLERHASYIDSWGAIMRKDKHAFTRAASLAQAASDYLLRV
jgi:antirestriction protein ArdC